MRRVGRHVLPGERTARSNRGRPSSPGSLAPVGFSAFPGEIFAARAAGGEGLSQPRGYNEVNQGGHFAAGEEPQILSEEVRAAFRSLR